MSEVEVRIREAARLIGCFEIWRASQIASEKGISPAEFETGRKLAALQFHNRHRTYAKYGTPSYGTIHPSKEWIAEQAAAEAALIAEHKFKEEVCQVN